MVKKDDVQWTRECLTCKRAFYDLAVVAEVCGQALGEENLRVREAHAQAKTQCLEHCGPVCCRVSGCENARPTVRSFRSTRTCTVCHRPRWMFVRFAPCSDECTVMRYRSSRRVICMVHRPTAKPRIHIDYCSLEHFNDWEKGHRERVLGGRRVRWRRHREERLSMERYRREKARR